MAQTKVTWVDSDGSIDFELESTWYIVEDAYENFEIKSGSLTAGKKTITFNYELPTGSEIKSAKIYSTWEIPSTGPRYRRITFGDPESTTVTLDNSDTNSVADVPSELLASPITAEFSFMSNGYVVESTGKKTSSLVVSDIYLLIEYTCGVYLYHVEEGVLVPYQLYHVENGELVPYQLFHVENNSLVQY